MPSSATFTSTRWTWLPLLVAGVCLVLLTIPLRHLALAGLVPRLYPLIYTACWLLGPTLSAGALIGIFLGASPTASTPVPPPDSPDHLTIGWDPEHDWIRLDAETQQRHTLLLGSSGSGKTQLLLSLLAQQIAKGGGALMIDAKVDRSARQAVQSLCHHANRLHDLKVLWPTDPTCSDTWNPLLRRRTGLHSETLEEVISRVMALWPTDKRGDSEFFRGAAQDMIRAVLGAMQRVNPYVTFNDLYLAITTPPVLEWLNAQMTPGTEEGAALMAFLSNYQNQQGRLNVDHLKRVTGGTSLHLSAYAWGSLGKIINHTAPTLDLLEAVERGQIVYVALPILAQTEEAIAMARMLIADLKQVVGILQQREEKPVPPFLVLMDEASAYANIQGIERLFEQARSANIALVATSQVLSGFAQSTPTQLDFILGNTATKIIMALGDFTSAETMADTIGQELAWFQTESQGKQKGTTAQWVSPLPHQASKGTSQAEGAMQRYDYIVRPELFLNQPTGHAVVFTRDPRHGGALHRHVRTALTNIPQDLTQDFRDIPHPVGPTGLNLLRRIQQGGIGPRLLDASAGRPATATPSSAPTRRRRQPVHRRETPDLVVLDPQPPIKEHP